MQTLRSRKLLQPSQIERLLEAYATRSGVMPEGAYQLRDPDSLPPEVRLVLNQITGTGQVWTCWAYATRLWLFTGEVSLPLSRERRAPVLRVNLYGEDGQLKESGAWMTHPDGDWQRCPD